MFSVVIIWFFVFSRRATFVAFFDFGVDFGFGVFFGFGSGGINDDNCSGVGGEYCATASRINSQ